MSEVLTCAAPDCDGTFERTHRARIYCDRRCMGRATRHRRRLRPDWPEERARLTAIEAERARRPEVKERRLRRLYGLSYAEYQEMFAAQEGRCAICGQTQARDLVVDHCHDTGRVRALLCGPCNSAIGLLGEDPERIRRAARYIEET